MTPLTLFPDLQGVMPLRYLGPAAYFARLAAYPEVVILDNDLYDKRRKEVHRYSVADTHGPIDLTVPVAKPHGIPRATWLQTGISAHNSWWHIHRVTLESGYGRTPFFEYYIDHLLPFLSPGTVEIPSVAELNIRMLGTLLPLLGIDTHIIPASTLDTPTLEAIKNRSLTPGETALDATLTLPQPPYWQVRADRRGFLPGLSILDLLFNLGPEAPIYLRRLQSR